MLVCVSPHPHILSNTCPGEGDAPKPPPVCKKPAAAVKGRGKGSKSSGETFGAGAAEQTPQAQFFCKTERTRNSAAVRGPKPGDGKEHQVCQAQVSQFFANNLGFQCCFELPPLGFKNK